MSNKDNGNNKNSVYDTLSEYHLHSPDTIPYEVLAQLLDILKRADKSNNTDKIVVEIQQLLTDAKSEKLFHLICEKHHIDYHKFQPPRLVLHLICLSYCCKSASFVADKLGLDSREASQLLEQLKHNFTIDDPLAWLERLHLQTKEEYEYHKKFKEKQLYGHDLAVKPADTAEDRKQKLRRRFKDFFKFWYK